MRLLPLKAALLTLGILGTAIIPVTAQPATITSYLATARHDLLLQARQATSEYRYGAYIGLPFVRDLEIKVRNQGFAVNRQRYTLELMPRAFGEAKAARRYNAAQVDRSAQRNRVLLNRALLDRHLMALDLLMHQAAVSLSEAMIVLSEDRLKVLDQRKYGPDFDLNILVEAEANLTKEKTQILDLRKEIEILRQRIAADMAPRVFTGFDTTGLVNIEAIISEVEQASYAVDSGHVYLQYLNQGLDLAEKRYRLERTEGRQFLNSVSFSYDVGDRLDEMDRRDNGKNYDMAQAYILEAAFRIPNLTAGNQDLNRRKEEFLAEKEDVEKNRRDIREAMQKDIEDIRSLVAQFRYLTARENEVDAEASLKKYMQISGVDPLILLSIKEGSLKNQIKLQAVKFGIMMNYVKVMDATGRLSQLPLRNFLATGREALPE